MFKSTAVKRQFQFADIKLDPETGQVWRQGEEITLPKLSFQLLTVLAQNAPNVLEQEELVKEIWPDMVVSNETLKQRVRLLRKAIDDDAQAPTYIGVVRGRGYRLLPEVRVLLSNPTTPIEYDFVSNDKVPSLSSVAMQKLWQRVSLGLSLFILMLMTVILILNHQLEKQENGFSPNQLAILPFVNVTGNREDDYLASGMTNELITVMSSIDSLQVAPSSSVSTYLTTERSISEVSQSLRVGSILDGALYRQNGLIHFNFKLFDTNNSELLWQAEYNFESSDILAIQRKVINQVTVHLKASLDKSKVMDSLSLTQPTQIVKAYDIYLKGREYYYRYRYRDNLTAIKLYQQALNLDPNFALAYAGLADAYSQAVFQFGASDEWRLRALTSAQKAVDLSQNNAEAHKALGLALYLNGSIQKAITANLRAIKLSPRLTQAATNLAYFYVHQGELDKAMQWNLRALELSPNYAPAYAHLALTLMAQEKFNQAQENFDKAIQLQPDYSFAISLYADFLLSTNENDSASKLIENALKNSPNDFTLLKKAGELALFNLEFELANQYLSRASEQVGHLNNSDLKLLIALSNQQLSEKSDSTIREIHQWQQQRLVSSEDPKDYFLAALAYALINKNDESLKHLSRSVKLGWTNLAIVQNVRAFTHIVPQLKKRLIAERTAQEK